MACRLSNSAEIGYQRGAKNFVKVVDILLKGCRFGFLHFITKEIAFFSRKSSLSDIFDRYRTS